MIRASTTALVFLLLAACAPNETREVALSCEPDPRMPLEGRASPYDSVQVPLGDIAAKICYGRPSARERTMIGGEYVPYGRLWRTGANEPTVIHLPAPATIAGIEVSTGSYSLYTVPGSESWEIVVNASTSQWGIESRYTGEVRAAEVGRATVPARHADDHVETFTITAEPVAARGSDVVLAWEHSRVTIPVRRAD